MISRLWGADLRFLIDRVEVPLEQMRSRFVSGAGPVGLISPMVKAPPLPADFGLAPLRALALREILAHARHGSATVRLPLRPIEKRFGPLTLGIPENTVAEISLTVRDTEIMRKQTSGRLDPNIKFPLGIAFRGLYIDDDGDIIADIDGVPDVNLSFLALGGLRVPRTLDGVLARLFGDTSSSTKSSSSSSSSSSSKSEVSKTDKETGSDDTDPSPIDTARITVVARGVVPKKEAFSLGGAGTLELGGEGSSLDVNYAKDDLGITGDVNVTGGHLLGRGFRVNGVQTRGHFDAHLGVDDDGSTARVNATVEDASVSAFDVELSDGTALHFENLSAREVDVTLKKTGDAPAVFSATGRAVSGQLRGGVVMLHVGDKQFPVVFSQANAEGSVTVSDKHVAIDVELNGVTAEIHDVEISFGIAHVVIKSARLAANGRLRAGTDFGAAFTGNLSIDAEISSGQFALGPLAATIAEGTRATLHVSELALDKDGVLALVMNGRVDAALAAGSMPLGRESTLRFSDGATASLDITSLTYADDDKYPTVVARGEMTAAAQPTVVDQIFEIPRARAHVVASSLSLSREGILVGAGVEMRLQSEDDASSTS